MSEDDVNAAVILIPNHQISKKKHWLETFDTFPCSASSSTPSSIYASQSFSPSLFPLTQFFCDFSFFRYSYNLETSTWDVVPVGSGPLYRYGHSLALHQVIRATHSQTLKRKGHAIRSTNIMQPAMHFTPPYTSKEKSRVGSWVSVLWVSVGRRETPARISRHQSTALSSDSLISLGRNLCCGLCGINYKKEFSSVKKICRQHSLSWTQV